MGTKPWIPKVKKLMRKATKVPRRKVLPRVKVIRRLLQPRSRKGTCSVKQSPVRRKKQATRRGRHQKRRRTVPRRKRSEFLYVSIKSIITFYRFVFIKLN